MNWTNVGDILFLVGALVVAAFLVYGGWLSITAPEADPHHAPGEGRARGATPEAQPFPPRRYDAALRYASARRRASATSRRAALS